MIDPDNVINFNRTQAELEEFLLFCVCVAGKNARRQAKLLDDYLNRLPKAATPFERIIKSQQQSIFNISIETSHLGKYFLLKMCFRCLVGRSMPGSPLNLKTCTVQELENVYGIGPKTARFFLLHSRPNQRLGVIDTHILKLLKEKGFKVTKSTPPAGPTYRMLETAFLELADEAKMSPADFDLMIWKRYSHKLNITETEKYNEKNTFNTI